MSMGGVDTAQTTVRDLADEARRIATEIAGPAADDVDRRARFPHEAVTAMREARLLGAMVPRALGGLGASTAEVAEITRILAHSCANSAMVFAMHQIEVASLLAEEAPTEWVLGFLRRIASEQLLIANAGSEVGLGGQNASICAVQPTESGFHLEKHALAISYGEYADCIVATARRSADTESFDSVTVINGNSVTVIDRNNPLIVNSTNLNNIAFFVPGEDNWHSRGGWNAGGGVSMLWGHSELFVEARVLGFNPSDGPMARQVPVVLGFNWY